MNIIALIKMENGMMTKSILTSCIFVSFCSYVTEVAASGYLFESEINARTTYVDNANFVDNSSSVTDLMIEPKAKLTYKDANWDTTAHASVAGTKYSSKYKNDFDSYFDLGTAYQTNRNTYSIVASYADSSNLAADVDSSILGLSSEAINTKKLGLAPKYTRSLTERLALSASYSFVDASVSPDNSTFVSFETNAVTGSLEYKLSQRTELSLIVTASDYTSENDISEYEMLNSTVNLNYQFSEMVSMNASAGVNDRDFITRDSTGFLFAGSKIIGQPVEATSSGGVYNVGIDAKWVEFSASKTTNANTLGGLTQVDKLHAKFRLQISHLIGTSLAIDHSEIEELNTNVVGSTRDSTTIRAAVNFSVAPNLSLRGEYIRVDQKLKTSAEDVGGNSFLVNLKYEFPSI